MTKQNRRILDDIREGARQLWDEVERLFKPSKQQPQPVRVPVRSRPPYPQDPSSRR